MSLILFRAGKNLIVGEAKNKEGSVWHLELRCEVTEAGPYPLQPEMVQVSESMVINPSFASPISEASGERRFRALVHESVLPFLVTSRAEELGGRTIVAYERDRRGIGFQESGGEVQWSPLNDLFADAVVAEALALEAVRSKLVERKLLDPTYRGRISEAAHQVTERFHVYMKQNPFRDITLIREGTVVCAIGYHQGCVVLEADGEEFWLPIEEADFCAEEYKNDLWYFHMDDDADGVPDPLAALPSKVALRTHSKRNRGTLQWDAKGDLKKVAGHLTPEPKIDNHYTVMGETFLGTVLQHFWRHGEPERYDIAAKPGGTDKAKTKPEDALARHRQGQRSMNKVAVQSDGKEAVPRNFTYAETPTGDVNTANIDDGTVAENAVDKIVDHILSGASVSAIFAERLDPEQEKKNREEALKKAFPGSQHLITPALRQPAVSP